MTLEFIGRFVLVVAVIGFAIGVSLWKLNKDLARQQWLYDAWHTPPDEEMPRMIFITDEILEIHDRYKSLRDKDRLGSRDETNAAEAELLYAVLDLIDPEYWKTFEI